MRSDETEAETMVKLMVPWKEHCLENAWVCYLAVLWAFYLAEQLEHLRECGWVGLKDYRKDDLWADD